MARFRVRKDSGRKGDSPSRPRRAEKRISCPGPPTVVVLHPLDQALDRVYPEAVGVGTPPGVACPAVEIAAGVAAVSVVAELVVVFLAAVAAVSAVAEPVVVFVVVAAVVVSEVGDPVAVFVAVASVADVAEPRASVDIALVFDVLVPVSVVVVEVDSSARPNFFVFPNIDYYSSSSSSVEAVG